jgi:tetratricopeptide (TPR) repeat protein
MSKDSTVSTPNVTTPNATKPNVSKPTAPHSPSSSSGSKADGPSSSTPAAQMDMRNADAVQSSMMNLWQVVEDNSKLIAALLVVAVLGGVGMIALQFLEKRQERSAQSDFYAVHSKFTELRDAYDRAKIEALMPGMTPPDATAAASEKKAASGDLAKDYGSLMEEFETVAREHAGTSGGTQAALLASEIYLEYQQPEKALVVIEGAASKIGSKHVLKPLTEIAWGNALANKGDCQAAISHWQQVLDNPAATFVHADAGLRAGLCLEQMNQPEKAIEMYRKVTTEAPDSTAGRNAKGLLRALEIKQPVKEAGATGA